jgi:NAD(P)H dehydrogenase (quinone)
LSVYTTMYHWGAIVVAPGYTDQSAFTSGGNPYGTSVTIDQDGNQIENVQQAVKQQAKRTVAVAKAIVTGLQT